MSRRTEKLPESISLDRMNRDRMLALLGTLCRIRPRVLRHERMFDMRYWVRNTKSLTASDCGTKACAAGWYILENPTCGLLISGHRGSLYAYIINEADAYTRDPDCSFEVLADHFGLSTEDATWLFGGYSHPGDKEAHGIEELDMVIRRVEFLLWADSRVERREFYDWVTDLDGNIAKSSIDNFRRISFKSRENKCSYAAHLLERIPDALSKDGQTAEDAAFRFIHHFW